MKKILLLILLPTLLNAMPWGKDADLAYTRRQEPCPPQPKSPFTRVGEVLISFHQNVISRADGPRSHFVPSSSQYTLEAIRKYGFFTGYLMGCDRLMRENNEQWIYPKTMGPYCELKYNPVP